MNEPVWKHLSKLLADKIRQGGFSDGSFPTIKELCKEYSVSDITARRIISELSANGLIDKARGRGCSVIKKSGPEEIFLLLQEHGELESVHSSIIFAEIYRGLLEESGRCKVSLTPVSAESIRQMPKENLSIISMRDINPELLASLKPARVVICHTDLKYENAFSVESDLKSGAFKAVDYLIQNGHRRIAIVTVSGNHWFSSRLEGYIQAHGENGIGVDFSLIKSAAKEDFTSNAEALYSLMTLSDPPTAIFAVTDMHALNIIRACSEKGLRVPEDIAVIGFDNIPESAISNPPLSTVETFWRKKGESAVRLALSENPHNIAVDSQLILRKTT